MDTLEETCYHFGESRRTKGDETIEGSNSNRSRSASSYPKPKRTPLGNTGKVHWITHHETRIPDGYPIQNARRTEKMRYRSDSFSRQTVNVFHFPQLFLSDFFDLESSETFDSHFAQPDLKNVILFADTCILVALVNSADPWHRVVREFVQRYLSMADGYLYITDRSYGEFCIVCERSMIDDFKQEYGRLPTRRESLQIKKQVAAKLRSVTMGEGRTFLTQSSLTENIRSTALTLWEKHEIGETDALFVAICPEYRYVLLTVDNKLVRSLSNQAEALHRLGCHLDIFYADPSFRTITGQKSS